MLQIFASILPQSSGQIRDDVCAGIQIPRSSIPVLRFYPDWLERLAPIPTVPIFPMTPHHLKISEILRSLAFFGPSSYSCGMAEFVAGKGELVPELQPDLPSLWPWRAAADHPDVRLSGDVTHGCHEKGLSRLRFCGKMPQRISAPKILCRFFLSFLQCS